jgi:O-antigen chain-terminating methyltransferase
MQIDDIIRRVKAEAGAVSPAAAARQPGELHARPAPGLELKSCYHVRELLAIDGDALVAAVYRCLLRREPDPAAAGYRQRLASGTLSPIGLIGRVRFSAEGRRAGVTVDGLVPRLVYSSLKKIPLFGYLLDVAVTVLRLPTVRRDLLTDLQLLRTELSLLREDLSLKAERLELERKADRSDVLVKADRAELERKADRAELERKADRSEVLAYRDAVRYAELYFHRVNEQLQALLGELKDQLPAAFAQGKPAQELVLSLAAGEYDKLYLDFESLFRGSQQQVSEGLAVYADLLVPCGDSPGTPQRALDLGCGRGEMLHCLHRLGYAATGVDLNRLAVASCLDQGLQAVCADALSYLEEVEPGSLAVITSLHMIEHLSYPQLLRLLQAALPALAPGGMLLLETPNPRNLLVGAGDFYRDFTHVKPLFPDTLGFLLDYCGYAPATVYFFADAAGGGRRLVPAAEVRFDELSDYLQVSRDYAVAGYKRCG